MLARALVAAALAAMTTACQSLLSDTSPNAGQVPEQTDAETPNVGDASPSGVDAPATAPDAGSDADAGAPTGFACPPVGTEGVVCTTFDGDAGTPFKSSPVVGATLAVDSDDPASPASRSLIVASTEAFAVGFLRYDAPSDRGVRCELDWRIAQAAPTGARRVVRFIFGEPLFTDISLDVDETGAVSLFDSAAQVRQAVVGGGAGWNHAALVMTRAPIDGKITVAATLNGHEATSVVAAGAFEELSVAFGANVDEPGWVVRYDNLICTATDLVAPPP